MKNLLFLICMLLVGCGSSDNGANNNQISYSIDSIFKSDMDFDFNKKLNIQEDMLQYAKMDFYEDEIAINSTDKAQEFLESKFMLKLNSNPIQIKTTKNFKAYKFIQDDKNALKCGSSINLLIDKNNKPFKSYVRKIDNFSNCTMKDNYYLQPRQIKMSMPPKYTQGQLKEVSISVFNPDPITSSNNTLIMPTNSQEFINNLHVNEYVFSKKIKALQKDNKLYLSNNFAMAVDIEEFLEDGVLKQQAHRQGITSVLSDQNFNNTNINDISFLEQMAYYHISESLQRLQNLGYENIIEKPLRFDALLWDGDNKTAYYPDIHVMALSAGAINDGLDAQVIIHELGHALIYALSKDFDGGDTGGIHEGFADYWAGQYMLRIINQYSLDKIDKYALFKLDSYYSSSSRRLDKFGMYDIFSGDYLAHQSYNGILSDELISSSLFSSLERSIKSNPHAIDEINEILLESFAGLGYATKVHQFALSVVKTAQKLYPQKNYKQIFEEEFNKRNMLYKKIKLQILNEHANNGENLKVLLQNLWYEDINNISLHVKDLDSNQIIKTLTLDFLETGRSKIVEFDLPKYTCGSLKKFEFSIAYNVDEKQIYTHSFNIGKVRFKNLPQITNVNIPHATKTSSNINSIRQGLLERNIKIDEDIFVDDKFAIILDITSKNKNGLKVVLKAPNGISLDLTDNTYEKSFKQVFTINNQLSKLNKISAKGRWFLQISNSNINDFAKLNSFGISKIVGHSCK